METPVTRVMHRNDPQNWSERREPSTLGRVSRVNVGSSERFFSTLLGGLLTVYGLRRRGRAGFGMALVGGKLLYRGTTGHCLAYRALGISTSSDEAIAGEPAQVDHDLAVEVRRSIEIARPRAELFAIWRDFSKLPHFMTHLERVDVLSHSRSHWVTKGPAGSSVEWDAEIVGEKENAWIAWQTIEPAQVPNNGTVMFRDAPSGNTEIFVTIEAQPPAGKLGDLVARVFGKSPDRQVRMALERFREMAEGGYDWSADAGGPSLGDREVAFAANDSTALDDLAHPFSPPNSADRTTKAGDDANSPM